MFWTRVSERIQSRTRKILPIGYLWLFPVVGFTGSGCPYR
jgi:hypothetical protein